MLLDSGGVLVRPISGEWFPPPAFAQVLTDRGVEWDGERLRAGVAAGEAHLDEAHRTPMLGEDAEDRLMARYFEILLESVAIRDGALVTEMVGVHRDLLVVEAYPWTEPALDGLRAMGLRTVVVSNAWPKLRRTFHRLGLDRLVDGMVISAELGVTKPHPLMYRRGLELAGCDASEAVFVDDWAESVVAAEALGIRSYCLPPEGSTRVDGVREIADLRELLPLISDRI